MHFLDCGRWVEMVARNCFCALWKKNISSKTQRWLAGTYEPKCYSSLAPAGWRMSVFFKNMPLIDWHSLCGGVDSIRDCWCYTTTSCDGVCASFQIHAHSRASPGLRCGRAMGRLQDICLRYLTMFISVRPLVLSLSMSSIAWRKHDSDGAQPRRTTLRGWQSGALCSPPHITPHCSLLASFASLGNISINISALPLISCVCEAPR